MALCSAACRVGVASTEELAVTNPASSPSSLLDRASTSILHTGGSPPPLPNARRRYRGVAGLDPGLELPSSLTWRSEVALWRPLPRSSANSG